MKKLVIIAVILGLLISPFAFATNVSAATTISEPSFETVNYWTYSETDADWSGALSTIWKTQGNSSYLFSTSGGNLGNGKYCQILQSVDFTSIDTICFDARLWASSGTACEARCVVGATTVWSQIIPNTETNYLHQEVDVSGYTGTQDLIFRVITTTPHANATCLSYFDNIKIWGSHNSDRTTVNNDFTSYGDIIYMYGENFDTTGTYKVAYYDGGTAHDGADGAKVETDTYTDDADGILDESQCRPADWEAGPPAASYGTWHAVVYKTTASMPNSYDLVSTDNASYVITDSFTVQEAAIPEFPTVMAAIGVAGLCCGIYFRMRKRYRRVAVRIQ